MNKIKLNQTHYIIIAFVVVLSMAIITDFGQTILGSYYSSPSGYWVAGTYKWTSLSTASLDVSKWCSGTENGEQLHPSYAIDGFTIKKNGPVVLNVDDGSETIPFTYTSKNGDSGSAPCTVKENVDELCYFNNGKTTIVAHLTSITYLDMNYIKAYYDATTAECATSDIECVTEEAYNEYVADHERSWTFQFYIKNTDDVVWDCTPGTFQTKECWDGSTVNYKKCSVDGQWISGTSCPLGCGDGICKTSEKNGACEADCPTTPITPTPSECTASGTQPSNSYWSTTSCAYECNNGYEKLDGQCIVASSGGDEETIPTIPSEPSETTTTPTSNNDIAIYVVIGILVLAIGVLMYYAIIKK